MSRGRTRRGLGQRRSRRAPVVVFVIARLVGRLGHRHAIVQPRQTVLSCFSVVLLFLLHLASPLIFRVYEFPTQTPVVVQPTAINVSNTRTYGSGRPPSLLPARRRLPLWTPLQLRPGAFIAWLPMYPGRGTTSTPSAAATDGLTSAANSSTPPGPRLPPEAGPEIEIIIRTGPPPRGKTSTIGAPIDGRGRRGALVASGSEPLAVADGPVGGRYAPRDAAEP